MSARKPETQRLGHRTEAELAIRQPVPSPLAGLTPGEPPRPKFDGPSREREWWLLKVKQLSEARRLAVQDGPALRAWVDARLSGNGPAAEAVHQATWANRPPFPDTQPAPPPITIEALLDKVRTERGTFAKRMMPTETVCCDGAEAYAWPEGDPATVARLYASDVLAETIVAGDLIRRAAHRFLSDLENAAGRGLYFDPMAARHVCLFAEQFCGLKLLPWETFVLVNIFGWKRASGLRRFTEAWISCGKKNGKTALASTIGLWGLVADLEPFPDVFSAATKKDQARLIWRDAKRAVIASPLLRSHVHPAAAALLVKDTDGSFAPLSADEKSMDGLRPHFILMDEVSFWGDREQFDKLAKGIVSRTQPLVFAVTTAGKDRECFAYGKFDLAEKILRGIFVDDSTFAAIYTIDLTDKWEDEACWPKANPSIGLPGFEPFAAHLRKTRDEAVESPSGVTSFLQYHCNIWPDKALSRVGSIRADSWEACDQRTLMGENLTPMQAIEEFLSMNRDNPFFVGLDIGLTSDLTALVRLYPFSNFPDQQLAAKKVVIATFFMPEHRLLEKEKQWRVPLSQWVREGWISLHPGDLVDVREVKKHLIALTERMLTIRDVRHDPWKFKSEAAELVEYGINCVAVPQQPSQLTAPSYALLTAIRHKEIVHFGNPVLAWMAGNVILQEDEDHKGIRPDKLSPNEKIDGIAALINALHGGMTEGSPCLNPMTRIE